MTSKWARWRLKSPASRLFTEPFFFLARPKKLLKLCATRLFRGIHRRQGSSPHKGPVTRKMFPFDVVIMLCLRMSWSCINLHCEALHLSVCERKMIITCSGFKLPTSTEMSVPTCHLCCSEWNNYCNPNLGNSMSNETCTHGFIYFIMYCSHHFKTKYGKFSHIIHVRFIPLGQLLVVSVKHIHNNWDMLYRQ